MNTMLRCRIIVRVLATLALSGCYGSHPIKPLAPRYPDAIRSANAQGNVTARVRIARTGKIAFDVDPDTSSGLLAASVRSALWKTKFAPARTLGISHSSELQYVFRFVLYRPARPLRPEEHWTGLNHIPNKCPASSSEREVIVCGEAVPSTWRSVHSTSLTSAQPSNTWPDRINALERDAIRASNAPVARVGAELRIQLRNGRTVILRDDTTGGPTHSLPRYAGYLRQVHSHVVHVLPLEGTGNYHIIDDSTGASTVVWGMPVISPDGTRFAITSMASEDGSDTGLIEVWKILGRKPEKEFSCDTSNETWDPSDAAWRDSVTIEFVKNSHSDPSEPYVKTAGRLVRTGTKWVLAASNRSCEQ